MRSSRILVGAAVLLVLTSTGCCKQSQPHTVPESGGWSGSILHINFRGLIAHTAHATDANPTAWRALLVDTKDSQPIHVRLISIPLVEDTALLQSFVETSVQCVTKCDFNIDGLGIQFVDFHGTALQPAFSPAPDFDAVPHLKTSVGPTPHDFVLTTDAYADFPPNPQHLMPFPGRKIAAFVEMSGGILSVLDEFECYGHFKHEKDEDSRAWPDTLRLTAYSRNPIIMQIKGPKTNYKWQTIKFKDSSYVTVSISNSLGAKEKSTESHFPMYTILSSNQAPVSEVQEKLGCHGTHQVIEDLVAGCGNSTFP
jgi:hypothetical protein